MANADVEASWNPKADVLSKGDKVQSRFSTVSAAHPGVEYGWCLQCRSRVFSTVKKSKVMVPDGSSGILVEMKVGRPFTWNGKTFEKPRSQKFTSMKRKYKLKVSVSVSHTSVEDRCCFQWRTEDPSP